MVLYGAGSISLSTRTTAQDEEAIQPLIKESKSLDESIATVNNDISDARHQVVQIEKSMLDFYYKHVISSDVAEVQSRLPYYAQSDLSKLKRRKKESAEEFSSHHAAALSEVEALEESVERDLVKGTLATQQQRLRDEEKALRQLEQHLSEKKDTLHQIQHSIHKEEESQLSLEKERLQFEATKRRLEDQKRRQMDNVETIRDELAARKEKLKDSAMDLRHRELAVQRLKDLIAERETSNKRRRKR